MLRLLRIMVRMNLSVHEIVENEEICAHFAVRSQTAKVMATVMTKYLVKVEKTLNLYKIF